VQSLLDKKNERNNQDEVCDILDLNQVNQLLSVGYTKPYFPYQLFINLIMAICTIKKLSASFTLSKKISSFYSFLEDSWFWVHKG
jgi:hypothetical protein